MNQVAIPARLVDMVGFVTSTRVCGELSVSRALGDAEYKGTWKKEFLQRNFKADLISAEPEITEEIQSASDKFIVLACDGAQRPERLLLGPVKAEFGFNNQSFSS